MNKCWGMLFTPTTNVLKTTETKVINTEGMDMTNMIMKENQEKLWGLIMGRKINSSNYFRTKFNVSTNIQ